MNLSRNHPPHTPAESRSHRPRAPHLQLDQLVAAILDLTGHHQAQSAGARGSAGCGGTPSFPVSIGHALPRLSGRFGFFQNTFFLLVIGQ